MATQRQADYFADTFNRLVGRHTGRTIQSRPGSQQNRRSTYVGEQRVAQARHGTGSRVTGDQRRQFRNTYGENVTAAYERALIGAQTDLDSVAQRNEKIQETFEELIEKDDNFQNSIAGRVLDVVSRPMYAVNEGLRAARQASNEGQTGFFETWDEALSGMKEGVTGRAKTGFGDYIEEFKGRDTGIGGMLNELEEEHPEVSKWTQRALGLGGELLLDPLNAIGGGSTAIARNSGKRLTTEVAQELAETSARNAVDNVFASQKLPSMNTPGRAGGRRPGLEVLSDEAGRAAREATDKAALEITGGPNRGKLYLGRGTYSPTVANAVAATKP